MEAKSLGKNEANLNKDYSALLALTGDVKGHIEDEGECYELHKYPI